MHCCAFLGRTRKRLIISLICLYFAAVLMLKIIFNMERNLTNFHREDSYYRSVSTNVFQPRSVSTNVLQPEQEEYVYWDSKIIKDDYEINTDNHCIILVWTSAQEMPEDNWPLEGTKLKGDCIITYYHLYLQNAGIVVIYQSQAGGVLPWLFYRNNTQIFVWWSDINPWHINQEYGVMVSQYDDFFNWTMNHRRDADIYFPLWRKSSLYSYVLGGIDAVDALLKKKNRTAVWMENECEPSPANRARMRYVVKLVQAKFQIDLIGNCFLNSLNVLDAAIYPQYRFYLSFIDSQNCTDYFTDQIWMPLRLGIVPVVFGPSFEDVANILPHNSFIHVSSFQSPKHLVKYLYSLENNETEYRKYFEWKKIKNLDEDDFKIIQQSPHINLVPHYETTGWTRLCEKYRDTNLTNLRNAQSIKQFAISKERKECIGG